MKAAGLKADWKLTVIPLGYLVLLLILPFIDQPFIWGTNHLRYHSGWVWVVCSLILVSSSIPSVRERVLALKYPSLSARSQYAALISIAALSFILLRNATHLLGDGYLLARELDHGFRKIANEPLSFWLLHRSRGILGTLGVSTNHLYFAWSFFPGIAYVALIPVVAAQISSVHSRAAVGLFLLLPGFIQLFFGYHETYPILYPLILVYVWTGLRARAGRLPAWIPCLVLGVMISLHFTMLTLVPSLCTILGIEGGPKKWVSNAFRLGAVMPGVLALGAVLWFVDFDFNTYLSRVSGETLLPLFASADHSIPYGAISVGHLTEFTNEMLLVFLPTMIALPFLQWTFVRSGPSVFLLSAALPAWVTTFLGFTVIGAFRDWDALAFPSVITTVWAVVGLVQCCNGGRIRHICCVVVAVAGVNTGLWVTVNADSERSTRRFEDSLRHSNLSTRARAYGWETLGGYYFDVNELDRASLSYGNAIENDPRHPRYPISLGIIQMQVGDYEGAAENFRKSTILDKNRYEASLNLGLALLQLNNPGAAVDAIGRAREIRPDVAGIPFALGMAYTDLKDYNQAIAAYEATITLQPDYVPAYLNLGHIHGIEGDNQKKRDRFEKVLALQPDHPAASSIRDWLDWYQRRIEE